MKKTDMPKSPISPSDDLLPEYHFDYRQAKPNRFASSVAEGSLVVVLEPEIARIFKNQETVRAILQAIASALPQAQKHEPIND